MCTRCNMLFLVACVALFCATGGNVWAGEVTPPENKPVKVGCLVDKPISAFQRDLLDLAFETATAIPIEPHIKDRSRTQEAVVAAGLELDQPQRAHGYIDRINNWRRGAGYADLALYCARHGKTNEAQHYLERAVQIARAPDVEAWRRDRIQAKIARTHTWLEQTRQTGQPDAGGEASAAGEVTPAQATHSDVDSFNEQIQALDALIASENFDSIKSALEAYAELFERFYEDVNRRLQVEEKIKTSLDNRPVLFRISLLMALAGSALHHADAGKALELVNQAQTMMDDHQWPPRYNIPFKARLAALRARAGDTQPARIEADAALALFEAAREKMVDIDRAGALRPLAEAYQSMGDTVAALAVYRRVVEEGVKNPNSRPRAEDLSATCRSMALHSVEPDASLWARLRQIRQALGPPW